MNLESQITESLLDLMSQLRKWENDDLPTDSALYELNKTFGRLHGMGVFAKNVEYRETIFCATCRKMVDASHDLQHRGAWSPK